MCGIISQLHKRINLVKYSLKHPKNCKACGGSAYLVCGTCGVALNFLLQKGDHKGKQCFFNYHIGDLFGLAHDDTDIYDAKKHDWAYP